ncbi:MAG: YkgJ family cysteine cluster protein [Methanoregula sp.]|uniref:YkgJ family cysteine cluster protein n=1 Tax=Methanoregula sp. TaxID=2052170 RepID=UPI003C749DED
MVTFDCDGCGKCCTSLGAYIRIERQLTEQDYYCRNGITDEVFPVHVQPEFADEIDEEFISGKWGTSGSRTGCIFMRKNPERPGAVCAIYPTRPQICREFRCYHMVIFDSRGGVAGRMIGRADIQTADPVLARIWIEEIRPLVIEAVSGTPPDTSHLITLPSGDPGWMQKVSAILASHGYRGEPVT